MTIFVVNIFSEEEGPGSSLIVSTKLFSSEGGQKAFANAWKDQQTRLGYEQVDEYVFYGGDWRYSLEFDEAELDQF